jgi:hypothetical protein
MIQPSAITDFVALCVHSNRLGLVYVKDGEIHDKAYLIDKKEDLVDIESYFDKVEYVLAFNIGIHRANLKGIFERNGMSLPDKKYVCVYNWAKDNIGTTTFSTVRDYFGILPDGVGMEFDRSGWHHRDYVLNAEMLSEAAILLQESCGLKLEEAISGDRASSQRKFWLGSVAKQKLPDFQYYDGEVNQNLFSGKKVVITGDFAFNHYRDKITSQLVELGAVSQSSVNSKTNIVVIGNEAGPSKLAKLKDLIDEGADIKILNEGHLIGLIK